MSSEDRAYVDAETHLETTPSEGLVLSDWQGKPIVPGAVLRHRKYDADIIRIMRGQTEPYMNALYESGAYKGMPTTFCAAHLAREWEVIE